MPTRAGRHARRSRYQAVEGRRLARRVARQGAHAGGPSRLRSGHRRGTETQTMCTVEKQVGTSAGAHGLTRVLPAGLIEWWGAKPGGFAAEVAAITRSG